MNVGILLQIQIFAAIGVTVSSIYRLYSPTETPFGLSSYVNFPVFLIIQIFAAIVAYRRSLSKQSLSLKMVLSATIVLILTNAISVYAIIYRSFGLLKGGIVTKDPTDCLYFSVVTWTTLGYGDVTPTDAMRMVAASEALLGYAVMSILIAAFIRIFGETSD